MTREEFEKTDEHKDMLYIGQNRQSSKATYSEENKDIDIEVNGSEGVKKFEVYEYLRLYGIYIGLKATDEESEVKQMATLVDGRAMMINLIENIKRKSEGKEIKKKYKYKGFIRSIDSHIQMSKAELENKLLQSQIKTNGNVIITNRVVKYILIITVAIYLAQLFVSIYGIVASKKEIPNQWQLKQQDSIIRMQEIRLYQRENQEYHRQNEIDSLRTSLKRLADSLHHKPYKSAMH